MTTVRFFEKLAFTKRLEHYQQRLENISKIRSCSQIYHMLTRNLAAYLNSRLEKTFLPRKPHVGFVVDEMLLGLFHFPPPCVTLTPISHTPIRASIYIAIKTKKF